MSDTVLTRVFFRLCFKGNFKKSSQKVEITYYLKIGKISLDMTKYWCNRQKHLAAVAKCPIKTKPAQSNKKRHPSRYRWKMTMWKSYDFLQCFLKKKKTPVCLEALAWLKVPLKVAWKWTNISVKAPLTFTVKYRRAHFEMTYNHCKGRHEISICAHTVIHTNS